MPTETLKTVGRSRIVTGPLYIERWVQIDSGPDTLYGQTGDLNRLDALADSYTASNGGAWWFGGPSTGEADPGVSNPAWYGQAIRVSFLRVGQASGDWHNFHAFLQGFIEAAFPGELIVELGHRFERPAPGDQSNPAKYVLWQIEGE